MTACIFLRVFVQAIFLEKIQAKYRHVLIIKELCGSLYLLDGCSTS